MYPPGREEYLSDKVEKSFGRREVVDLLVSRVVGNPEGDGGLTRGLEEGAK